MGFLDSVTSAVDRGAAVVGRTTRSTQLKMQITDLTRRRRELTEQLGSSLYEATKGLPELRAGREALYDGIASIDREREVLESQIREIEATAAAAAATPMRSVMDVGIRCPHCGATIPDDDQFCAGCGMPAAEARAEVARRDKPAADAETALAAGLTCSSCGSALEEGDLFCLSCGARVKEESGHREDDTADAATPFGSSDAKRSDGPHVQPQR